MKSAVVLAVFVVTVGCLLLEARASCVLNGKLLEPGVHSVDCINYTCNENGQLAAVNCPTQFCPGEQKGIKEDKTKPYPYCCPVPICA